MSYDKYEQRLARLGQGDSRLWPALRKGNIALGCGGATLAAIDKLSHGAGAVVAGQQAGLLTGPLYTIYKAASAIILAQELSEILPIPVVPVFWLASEDHDFPEVSTAWFPAGEHLKGISLPGHYSLAPAAEIALREDQVELVMAELKKLLPETEFTADLLDLVADCAGRVFSDWCASLLSRLFADAGLVILDSSNPVLREIGRPVFTAAVEKGADIHNLINVKAKEMLAAGRRPGLDLPPGHSHLFHLFDGQRLGLLRDGDMFADRHGTVSFHKSELLTRTEREPYLFSPNVVLRPLIQELALPVVAMVAGPGELAYLEQLEPVFKLMGLERPPLVARLGGLIIEPPIARLLSKYDLDPEQAALGLDSWLEDQLKKADPVGIEGAFANLRGSISSAYADVVHQLVHVDSQLEPLAAKNLAKVMEQVDWLEKKAENAHRQRHNQLSQHTRRLEISLVPQGNKQERVHNVFWYLNKYGPAFIDMLLQQPVEPDLIITP